MSSEDVRSDVRTAVLALGGNLGDVPGHFRRAAERLGRLPGCGSVRLAPCYRTVAVGSAAGGGYVNSAAMLETSLAPLELLDELQRLEDSFGRDRGTRWGARPIDLDVVFLGEMVVQSERLTLPHPGLGYRRFVLDPLTELIPEWRHPVWRTTIRAERERLLERPLPVAIVGTEDPGLRERMSAVAAGCGGDVALTWLAPHDETWDVGRGLVAWAGASPGPQERYGERLIELAKLPAGDLAEALSFVLRGALDEPTRIGGVA
ncbi:MAG: 2-amino-4-hydroxy-6-hydroxymethyldihydropteridine diphosphokinase [Planctomycetaceae bacterium]|nr:2-amino-4-hydroxy-6-hydroxymethyldihydropteridine diphosphokinase [Planctomycetaceae bacterium]